MNRFNTRGLVVGIVLIIVLGSLPVPYKAAAAPRVDPITVFKPVVEPRVHALAAPLVNSRVGDAVGICGPHTRCFAGIAASSQLVATQVVRMSQAVLVDMRALRGNGSHKLPAAMCYDTPPRLSGGILAWALVTGIKDSRHYWYEHRDCVE
jgi:hypothetical protein